MSHASNGNAVMAFDQGVKVSLVQHKKKKVKLTRVILPAKLICPRFLPNRFTSNCIALPASGEACCSVFSGTE
jgi:hypothetical protein